MDFPNQVMPPPPILTTFSLDVNGFPLAGQAQSLGAAVSAVWPVANKAYFYPFRLSDWATAYQLLFWVGATSNGNIDVGIYDSQKNLIVSSGSTAMSATIDTVQELNIADTVLPPGDYLLAASCSSGTGTCFRGGANADELFMTTSPVYEQTTAIPLPNPCVPVVCTDVTPQVQVIGIQLRSVF